MEIFREFGCCQTLRVATWNSNRYTRYYTIYTRGQDKRDSYYWPFRDSYDVLPANPKAYGVWCHKQIPMARLQEICEGSLERSASKAGVGPMGKVLGICHAS